MVKCFRSTNLRKLFFLFVSLAIIAVLLSSCMLGTKKPVASAAPVPTAGLSTRLANIEAAVGSISGYQGNQAADVAQMKQDIALMKQQLASIEKQVKSIASMQAGGITP